LRSRAEDVDGLLCATTQSRTSGLNLSEYLGISPSYIDTTILGGSSFHVPVGHALAAIQLGLCQVAVIAYGSTQRSVGRRQASVREIKPVRDAVSAVPAVDRLCARRLAPHASIRDDPEQLAAVAVAARQWALLNPAAWRKKPLTIAEVLGARMVSYPFTVRDICLVTDGGGAIVLTRRRTRQGPSKSRRFMCSALARRSPTPIFRACPT